MSSFLLFGLESSHFVCVASFEGKVCRCVEYMWIRTVFSTCSSFWKRQESVVSSERVFPLLCFCEEVFFTCFILQAFLLPLLPVSSPLVLRSGRGFPFLFCFCFKYLSDLYSFLFFQRSLFALRCRYPLSARAYSFCFSAFPCFVPQRRRVPCIYSLKIIVSGCDRNFRREGEARSGDVGKGVEGEVVWA